MAQLARRFVIFNSLERPSPFLSMIALNDVGVLDEFLNTHDVNVRDSFDRSLLMYAVMHQSVELVRFLCERHAHVRWRDCEGYTALHRAAQTGNTVVLGLLLAYMRTFKGYASYLEVKNCFGLTAIYVAAVAGHIDAVSMLLDAGAQVCVKGHDGLTILMKVAILGHEDLVDRLLSRKNTEGVPLISVNERNAQGWTALHFAVRHNRKGVAHRLIRFGADVNGTDELGFTPLMVARKCEMAIFLIAQGAYINKTTPSGDTAFSLAVRYHQEKIAGLLITQHTNVLDEKVQNLCAQDLPVHLHPLYLQERDEQTLALQLLLMSPIAQIKSAYDAAKTQDNTYLVSAIEAWFEAQKQSLVDVCRRQDLYLLQALLKKGIDPVCCRYRGMNLVLYAALSQPRQVVLTLMDYVLPERLSLLTRWALIGRGLIAVPRARLSVLRAHRPKRFAQSVLSVSEEKLSERAMEAAVARIPDAEADDWGPKAS